LAGTTYFAAADAARRSIAAMGSMSWIHWVLVIAVVALLFGGRGKLSGIMGDAAKGIRAFKDGLKDDTEIKSADKSSGALPRTEKEKEELRG
jgi:sec-independent protein translocase protein TatA